MGRRRRRRRSGAAGGERKGWLESVFCMLLRLRRTRLFWGRGRWLRSRVMDIRFEG